ncbi:MAG TPA: hypothetical protein VFP26_02785 [Gemmatimonadaceae bacterium]|nr:hypothetical protein [Gemmatimonadaceae bacterium]
MFRPIVSALVLSTATLSAQSSVPLYDNLGSYHKDIATTVPDAQRYFDQGLRLAYGFNHPEAVRSFTRAAELDPACSMCWWGIAYAYGPHVNAGMDSASGVKAYEAAQKAVALAANKPEWQRGYATAIAARYAAIPPNDRASLDSAYSRAMRDLAGRFPNDLDAVALSAESMMDLRPWDYWMADGKPYPGTDDFVRSLESVIAKNPNHPGACHYYIHAVEAVRPELAVPCAERLAALMPGEGHMVHMPAHIYVRVGRYNDAIAANVHAVHTDETFMEGQKEPTFYSMMYYPHNIHFLAFASSMAGQSARAISTSKALVDKIQAAGPAAVDMWQEVIPYHTLTLTTFGRWDDVLAQPLPATQMRVATALAYYARGVAYAAKADFANAQIALDTVKAIDAATAADNPSKPVTSIAMHALMGEIAGRSGNAGDAVAHFTEAVATDDKLLYNEPPRWYYQLRQSLGAALLRAGRPAEAEVVYNADLKRYPENGWSLYGLAAAQRALGKSAEAAETEKRFQKAWANADVKLTGSRF